MLTANLKNAELRKNGTTYHADPEFSILQHAAEILAPHILAKHLSKEGDNTFSQHISSAPKQAARAPCEHKGRSMVYFSRTIREECLFTTNIDTLPNIETAVFNPNNLTHYNERTRRGSAPDALDGDGLPFEEARHFTAYPYSAAVDGNISSLWQADEMLQDGQYFGLDLLRVSAAPAVYVLCAHTTYKVEISLNNREWKPVPEDSYVVKPSGKRGALIQVLPHLLHPSMQSFRYIRFVVTGTNENGRTMPMPSHLWVGEIGFDPKIIDTGSFDVNL